MRWRWKPRRGLWRAVLLTCVFLSQLVLAVFIHSDTELNQRMMSRWISDYLSKELRGTFELGTIEKLSTSRVILRNAAIFDEQHRRVATFERILVEASTAKALFRWMTKTEPLTLLIDSVRADGVRIRLHPSAPGGPPSLLAAIESAEPEPATATTRPLRVFLSNVELGDVSIDSTFSEFTTNSLRMRRVAGQLLVNQLGIAASLKRFSLDLDEPINLPVHAFGSLEFRSPHRLWGDVNLVLGEIPCSAHVEYQKESLKLEVHPFTLTPDAARQWFPDWPLQRAATVTLAAHGPLRELGVRSELSVDTTSVEAIGRVTFTPSPHADLAILARSFDVKSLLGAPFSSNLDAAARLSLEIGDTRPRLHFDGVIHPGFVAGMVTPRVDVEGQSDTEGLVVSGRSSDPQLPVRAAVVFRAQELQVDAQLDRAQLENIVPKTWISNLSGSLRVRAQAKIRGEVISASANVVARDLRTRFLSAGNAKFATQFEGALNTPEHWNGDLRLDCEGVAASPYFAFERLSAVVTGSPTAAHVQVRAQQAGVVKFTLDTEMRPFDGPALAETRLQLTRNSQSLSVATRLVSLSNETVVLEGLSLEGSAGQLRGNLGLSREHIFGTLEGKSVDLAALASLLALPALSGETQFALDVDTRRRPAAGHAQIGLTGVGIGGLRNITGSLDLQLDDDRLSTSLHATSDLVGDVSASAELTLNGSPMRLASYERAVGRMDLELLRVKLDHFGQLLGSGEPHIRGNADLRLSAKRSRASAPVDWSFSGTTSGFGFSTRGSSPQLEVRQLDLVVGAEFAGDTSALHTNWVLHRDHQPKASLVLSATMPALDEWWQRFVESDAWREVPFEAFLSIPRQNLADLSQVFSRPLGSGNIESRISLRGPVRSANLVLELRAQQLLLQALGNANPFDLEGLIEHTPDQTRVLAGIGSGQSTWAQINGVANVQRCPSHLICVAEWDGRAEVGFLGLPIGVIPVLAHLGLGGELRGVLTARRQAGITGIDAVLPVDNLRMSGQPLGQALLHLRSDENELVAGAKLLDASAQIDLEVHVPVLFRTLLPVRQSESPIRMAAAATGYDAAVLSPWLDEYVEGLSGELSGRLEVMLDSFPSSTAPDAHVAAGNPPGLAVSGYMTLDRGKGVLRSLGLAFSDLAVAAQATSTGSRTTVSVPTISLSTGDGLNNLRGSAVAELEAFSLRRLTARVDAAKQVPLLVNSVAVATLSGAADMELTRATDGFDVVVDFDDLEIHLPRNTSRQVMGLGENPDIVVLQPLGPEAWRKTRPRIPTEYRIRLSLGNRARVTRADLALPITGIPELKVEETVRPSGIIQLGSAGRLELFGKSFVIDRGRVTLDPDSPTNPQLDVIATWRGPTHIVSAHLQGTLEQAKLRLTSDPPLPSEARVMALLLGGGSGSDSSAGAGLGVGATLFNELLSGTALSSVEVRTSTGDRHANYTAAVPLRENLWFEATYQSPTNSTLPGTAAQRGFSGTVDYRFRRNWSVRTEVGTLGAGADLLWQYRY